MDDLDLAIVSALQYAPRGSWEPISPILGRDLTTVMRRWQRMARSGVAWVSCYPSLAGAVSGWVEIACKPTQAGRIAGTLAGDPHTITLFHITGDYDLLAVVVAENATAWSDYVMRRVGYISGVRSTRSTLFSEGFFVDDSLWRLAAISPDQAAACRELGEPVSPRDHSRTVSDGARSMVRILAGDGRMPASELALAAGIPERTAQRRLAGYLAGSEVSLRAEIARHASGWPITLLYWARVPSPASGVALSMPAHREVRMCAVSACGPANLVFAAAMRQIGDIDLFERELAETHDGLQITHRAWVSRPVKIAGALLDEAGNRTGSVPMTYWDPIPCG